MKKNHGRFLNLLILPKFGRSFYHVAVSYRFMYFLGFVFAAMIVTNVFLLSNQWRIKKKTVILPESSQVDEQVRRLSETARNIEKELEQLEETNRRIEEKTGIRIEPDDGYDYDDNYPYRGEDVTDLRFRLSDLREEIGRRKRHAQKTERQLDELLSQMSSIPTICPVREKDISSGFGYRVHPISGRWEFHQGVDMRMPHGSPIYAAADGRVTYTGWRYGYGLLVSISHKSGFSTHYAHCSRLVVREGEFVRKGQIIAFVGRTGTTTGNHLHYEVHYRKRVMNPQRFLDLSFRDFSRF